MEFVIEKGDQFEAKATQASTLASIDSILGRLDDEHKKKFKASCFGQFVGMRRIKFSGQLIHQLLNRLVKCDKEDELWFCFRDKPARFSLKEWALITGLNCGTGPDRKHMEYVRRTNRLLYHYFEGKSHITTKELEVAFAKCQDMRDKFKLGLVLFLESVLFCPDRRASIQLASLSIVEDLDLFYSCPWGKESFRRTIVTFKRDWRAKSKELKSKPKPSRFKYSLHGFPLALQVWAYEAMPHVGRQFASKFQHKVPRMVCWDATIAPTSSEISDVLNGHKLIVYCIIRPTDEENSKKYMRDFSPFESASRDRRFDEIIDNLDDYVPPGFEAPREREIDGMAGHSACEANLGDMEGSATHGSYLTPRFSPRHQDAPSDEGPSHIPQPRGVYLTQKEFNRRVSHIEKRFATLEQRISKEIDSVRSYCGVIEKKVDTVIELLQNSNTSRGFDHQSRYEHHSGYDHQDGNEHHNSFEHQSVYEDEGEVGFEHDRSSTSMFDNPVLVVYPSHVQSQYKNVKSLIHRQQSIMKVDSTAVYNPNSLMYSSEADFFDNEGQEICWSEEGRELQNRKRSTYFLSLYTNPFKRKKVEDGYSFDPFQVVDPLNANDFLYWQAPPSQRADLKLVKCNKKWYGDILTSGGWLIDKKKQKMHPSMYSDHNGSERLRRSPRLLSAKDSCSKAQEKIDSESPSSDFQGDEDHSDTQSDSTSDSAGLCSNYHRNEIPIGPLFQADIPDFCGEAYDNDSNWVGTLIWPLEKVEANLTLIEGDPIGKGRQESCRCQSPGSVECVRFHVGEKRMMVKLELGSAFYGWKFDSVGEEVALSWTKEEEYKFQDIVKSKPSSLEKYIWDELFNGLPCKGRESLVSYYYNVFLLQRRGYQNRTSTSDIDSEDEESELGPLLNRFEQIAAESPESIFYSPKKSHLNIR